jgi:hypothetical protein
LISTCHASGPAYLRRLVLRMIGDPNIHLSCRYPSAAVGAAYPAL